MKEHRGRWAGETVICVGTGPSLSDEQLAIAAGSGARIIAVNCAWRDLPRADVLYAGDYGWWRTYRHEVADSGFAGERWTISPEARRDFGVKLAKMVRGSGLPTEAGVFFGCDSGYQAVQLALWWGAARVVLIGYDQSHDGPRTHRHGDHPPPLLNRNDFQRRAQPYQALAAIRDRPPIVNASERTSLSCFPRSTLSAALFSSGMSVEPASSSQPARA